MARARQPGEARTVTAYVTFKTMSDDTEEQLAKRVQQAIEDGPYSFAIDSVRVAEHKPLAHGDWLELPPGWRKEPDGSLTGPVYVPGKVKKP